MPKRVLVKELENRETREGLIRLHTGVMLSTGERVLSVSHMIEKTNESYWVLARVHVQ
mgnify:FL=1